MNKRIALFPGTFDPFTIRHQSLVSRGLALVDEIIISIGINDKKQTYFTLEKRMEAIRCLYKDEPREMCIRDRIEPSPVVASALNARSDWIILGAEEHDAPERKGTVNIRVTIKFFMVNNQFRCSLLSANITYFTNTRMIESH